MTLIEAAKQVLTNWDYPHTMSDLCEAIIDLRKTVEEAEQQPVSLQCAHCHVTIETLNDKVVYLMNKLEQQAEGAAFKEKNT